MDNLLAFRLPVVFMVAGAVALTACAADSLPTGSDSAALVPAFAIGDATTSTPEFSKIKVCKSALSNASGSFTFSRVPVGDNPGLGTALAVATIAPGECIVVAEDPSGSGSGSTITITEDEPLGSTATITGQRIDADPFGGADVISDSPFANGDSRSLNQSHGFSVTFENIVERTGGQGCSPGYWKNHNFPAGYTKNQLFSSVFEDAFPGKTLQEVVSIHGGKLKALGRHTVSALLNAASLGGNYELTTAEVIAKFNAVFPGGDYNGLKAEFEALQDVDGRICPNPTGR